MDEGTAAAEIGATQGDLAPPTVTTRGGDPLLTWSRDHPVQAGVAAAVLLLITKLLFVARGDTATALALVEHISPVKAVIGTALANLSIFGAGLFVIAVAWLGGSIGRRRDPGLVAAICIPLLLVSVLVVPLPSTTEGSVQAVLALAFAGLAVSFILLYVHQIVKMRRWTQEQVRLQDTMDKFSRYGRQLAMHLPQQMRLLGEETVRLWAEQVKDETAPSPVGEVVRRLLNAVRAKLEDMKEQWTGESDVLDSMIEYVKKQYSHWEQPSMAHASFKEGYERLDLLAGQLATRVRMARAAPDRAPLAPFFEELHDQVNNEHGVLLAKQHETQQSRFPLDLSAAVAGLSFVFIAVITLTSSDMWLPAEELVIKGASPVVGYVLSETDDTTVILVEETRAVQRVKTDEITSRTVCSVGERSSATSVYAHFAEVGSRTASTVCVSALRTSAEVHEQVLAALGWVVLALVILFGPFLALAWFEAARQDDQGIVATRGSTVATPIPGPPGKGEPPQLQPPSMAPTETHLAIPARSVPAAASKASNATVSKPKPVRQFLRQIVHPLRRE